jgi:hypothetical protein
VTAAIPYGTNWIDAPDFRFHIDNLVLSSVLIIASIALAIWWVWDSKTPMLIAIVISLIASLFSGAHISNFLVTSFGKDSSFDQLGRVLRNYLPQAELDRSALIGENQTLLERALFGALTGEAQMIRAGEEPISLESLGPEISWVVKVGEADITGLPEPLITGSGYTIYSLATGNSLVPRNNDFESASEFCATPTNSGWICGDDTIVSLGAQVPARGELDLMIDVSERVADTELELVLGDSILTGTFPKGIYSVTLSFTNSSPASELIIRSKTPQEDTADEDSRFVRIVSAIVNR